MHQMQSVQTLNFLSLVFLLTLVGCGGSSSGDAEPSGDVQNDVGSTGGTQDYIAIGVINKNNYSAVLTQVFEVYSGRAYDKRLTTMPDWC